MIHIIENKLIDTLSTSDKEKIYNFAFGEEFMSSKDKGEINLGQMVNEYRKKTGYFSPAQTRDRESTYAQPQGKKGTYSYRAKGR